MPIKQAVALLTSLLMVAVQVVVVGTLAEDVGQMFGFDVRATDRDGDDDGRSAIANVFVSKSGRMSRAENTLGTLM